jgi:hypothetical protein
MSGPGTASAGTDGTESDSATASTADDPTVTYETLGEGDLRGLLTFTLYPADALTSEDIVGMAGAWRDASLGFDEVDDFFGVYGLDTPFPLPPVDDDTIEHNELLADFDWGAPQDWLLAGNAMKLRLADAEALACLVYRGGEPELELPPASGNFVPNYPMYASTLSTLQPQGCAPDPTTWRPDTYYDLVLYGGELFESNALVGQVHTPPAFELTAPDFAAFQEPVDIQADLELTWTGGLDSGGRLVIRAWDMFGRMMTARAADDGAFTIPASDLQVLEPGPMTITVARERLEDIPFTDGVVKVVTRYEHWGYFDLY